MPNHKNPLAEFTAENLISRLEFLTLKPKKIVDISLEAGQASKLIEEKYPEVEIIMTDVKNTIPLANHSVDFIFANLIFSFHTEWEKLLADCRRLLKPDGLLLFSCLGLDTLPELVEKKLLRAQLFDMHNIGDALIRNKFADPVLDVEHVTFQFRDREKFLEELKLNKLITESFSLNETVSAAYEIIYGHAFGPAVTVDFTADETGVVKIPLSHLKRKSE